MGIERCSKCGEEYESMYVHVCEKTSAEWLTNRPRRWSSEDSTLLILLIILSTYISLQNNNSLSSFILLGAISLLWHKNLGKRL